MGLKEQILAAKDTKLVPFVVEEWDNLTIYVKTLTGHELCKFRSYSDKQLDQDIYLLTLALCDETGKQIFEPSEVQALKDKSWAALAKLLVVAQKVNSVDEASFEEVLKNLKTRS